MSKPAPPTKFDEFLDADLVGMTVVDTKGAVLGELTEVMHRPGQDLLVVTSGATSTLVPFVKSIAVEVDLAAKRVVLDPPGGLFAN